MVLTYQSFESNHHKNEDQFVKNLSNPNPGFTDECFTCAVTAPLYGDEMVLKGKIVSESIFLSAMIPLEYFNHFVIPSIGLTRI